MQIGYRIKTRESSVVIYCAMTTRNSKILALLKTQFPKVSCPLNHSSAHELLFATILSAQCTDARVNLVTPTLFAKYKTVQDFADADPDELKQIIRSTGFYNNKAKNIIAAAQKIITNFGGKVPDTMEELITLPGVARKTANVLLHQWFHQNVGITVDTHVIRVSKWLGLTKNTDPVKIEQDLMQQFPQEEWGDLSLRLIFLGRQILTARNPQYKGTEWEEYVQTS